MKNQDSIQKRVETAVEISECLDHLIRLAVPTKEKIYRIYRQFREWGYHYRLEDIEQKCETYYEQLNHFNQARLIKEIFRIQATSEVASALALNFRNAKLEFSELSEVSNHLLSLLKRVSTPEQAGIDIFLTQAAVKRLTSPNWNNGEIFFSFADFFDALEQASFRRYGSQYFEQLKFLFGAMDPVINAAALDKNLGRPKLSQQGQAGVDATLGCSAESGTDQVSIEINSEASGFNSKISVNTQVLLQAEVLWLKELQQHAENAIRSAMPTYPLSHKSQSKEIRELESQVQLFNSLVQLEAQKNSQLQKYTEIETILRNTILLNVRTCLSSYESPIPPLYHIKGPGSDSPVKKKVYVLPSDLPAADIGFLNQKISGLKDFKWQGEIHYHKFSNLFVIQAKDMYPYFHSVRMVA